MKHACVVAILRIRPSEKFPAPHDAIRRTADASTGDTLNAFFEQPWVQHGQPELLFIKRAVRTGDRWSSHVAFPGGHKEPDDEDGLYTALRETDEEVGIDLAGPEWLPVGRLDDREVTSQFRRHTLMVLSPYIFLNLSPEPPAVDINPTEVSRVRWVPLSMFVPPNASISTVDVDIGARLTHPRWHFLNSAINLFVGPAQYTAVTLPGAKCETLCPASDEGLPTDDSNWHLWGLTLHMTVDFLMAHQNTSSYELKPNEVVLSKDYVNTILRVITPKFSALDLKIVDFYVNRKYKHVLGAYSLSPVTSRFLSSSDFYVIPRDINWASLMLNLYYEGFRRSLLVALVLRMVVLASAAFSAVKTIRHLRSRT